MTKLEMALIYAGRGWYVHPVHYIKEDGKCSCNGKSKKCKAAKHPKTNWRKWQTTDIRKITEHWTQFPDDNIGISTGLCSCILVVDIDPEHGGNESLQDADDSYDLKIDLDTYTVKTGSGGTHYYFYYTGIVKNYVGTTMLGQGIDIRSEGGYVVAPTSNHLSGGIYKVVNDKAPIQLPDKLLQLITTKHPDANINKSTNEIDNKSIIEGQRNTWLCDKAGAFLREDGKTAGVLAHLSELNTTQCDPPLEFEEVESIANHYVKTFNNTNLKVSLKTRWQNAVIDVDLPKREKAYFIATCMGLSMYMDKNGKCFPAQETLAKRLNMTRQSISKYLKIAEEKGLLKSYVNSRKFTGGFSYGYFATLPDIEPINSS